MLLAFYKSTRPGLQGVANRVIRLRLRSIYSHCEVVFEPQDGVGHLMPDGSCEPGPAGELWCASSVAAEAPDMETPMFDVVLARAVPELRIELRGGRVLGAIVGTGGLADGLVHVAAPDLDGGIAGGVE